MKLALTLLLLLPAVLVALLAAVWPSATSQPPTVAPDMSSAAQPADAVYGISPYLRLADLPGKGRGMVATRDIPQGTLLWSELPLTSQPYPASSASHLTPQAAVDELAIELLADEGGAYRLLCHHVELQHDGSAVAATATPADGQPPSELIQLGTSPLSGVIMRRSPVPDYSDLQFSIAASQVQSNAFDTSVEAGEVEAIRRAKRQRDHSTATAAAEAKQAPAEESKQSEDESDTAVETTSGSSSKSKRNAKKRAKRRAKQSTLTPPTAGGSSTSQRVLTLYVHISMLNHCCWPNAQVYWPAGDATDGVQSPRVYAISDVREGDELCISYRTDLLHYPTQLRQSVISSSWHFNCSCHRCTQPALFPRDAELLGLTSALSEEQQTRMLRSFEQLTAYAEQLSTNGGEAELHPRMSRQLFDFLALPLANAHWRRHRLRSLYIPLLLAQSTVSYVDKRRVLDEHIRSNARILPPLHASKLQYLLTFVQLVELEEGARTAEVVMKELAALEPHADEIMRIYK
ncbi:hypothetical protein MMC34_008783 [Xylographa carneopallida]|nr:hypothetical protein [Xylographa carneopallida]